ncbi:MAG: alpha-ketoacid dehydrogenase subunit beta [Elusimicrobia bacterium]|nr:MAG: alpha-ketoacid dehydrogenase subunit beta [Elusimicrobiota bacterium]
MSRTLKVTQAIGEALDIAMARDKRVYIMGLGATDPRGLFGTTVGLEKKYGSRILDMPTAENGMTGIATGSALVGMRPILMHQRLDFALLSMDQIATQAAKWCYMFGGQQGIPLVIRIVIGRGWGQGPQHSQSLQAWFGHIPGLKVVMPVTAEDFKGLLLASIEDNNPVIFIEHRWLHNISGTVPKGYYTTPIGKLRVVRSGKDITIAATSHMVLEAIRAAESLAKAGVSAEVLDMRTIRPLDEKGLLRSVRKTGRLIAADTGVLQGGLASDLVAIASERAFKDLKAAPRRFGQADCPVPTAQNLSPLCYPTASDLATAAAEAVGLNLKRLDLPRPAEPRDLPDKSFTGPF